MFPGLRSRCTIPRVRFAIPSAAGEIPEQASHVGLSSWIFAPHASCRHQLHRDVLHRPVDGFSRGRVHHVRVRSRKMVTMLGGSATRRPSPPARRAPTRSSASHQFLREHLEGDVALEGLVLGGYTSPCRRRPSGLHHRGSGRAGSSAQEARVVVTQDSFDYARDSQVSRPHDITRRDDRRAAAPLVLRNPHLPAGSPS